jgi:hypothetical protein
MSEIDEQLQEEVENLYYLFDTDGSNGILWSNALMIIQSTGKKSLIRIT